MISGHRPFAGDLSSLLYKVVHEPPPPMDVVWSRAHPDVERIIRKALAKIPDERYQSAGAMREEIRAVMATPAPKPVSLRADDTKGEKTTAAPGKIAVPARGINRNALVAGALALLALIAIAWFVGGRSSGGADGTAGQLPGAAPVTAQPETPPPSGLPLPTPPTTTAAPVTSASPDALPVTPAAPPDSPAAVSRPPAASETPVPTEPAAVAPTPEPVPSTTVSPATPSRGTAQERPRTNAGRASQPAPARRADPARCARLTERATLGEQLSAEDFSFLKNNCGTGR